MTEKLKEIAWNGIHLLVPSIWELGWIDTQHLAFESRENPVFEIKWRAVKGHFSHRSQLKKIIAQQKHHPHKNFNACQLPAAWEHALSPFSSQGFSWQSGPESGHGATLYCPICKNAVIFQIFNIGGRLSEPTVLDILKSLKDHRNDDHTAWIIFDMHALLPHSFQLKRYHFKPGNHELSFLNGSMAICLYRWAPASALLSQTSLSQFMADTMGLSRERLGVTSIQGHPAVEWRTHAGTGLRTQLHRLKQKPSFHWAVAWHIEKKNRIIGVRLDSRKPFKPDQMADICDQFRLNL